MLSDTDAGAGSLSLITPTKNQNARLPRVSQSTPERKCFDFAQSEDLRGNRSQNSRSDVILNMINGPIFMTRVQY